jgi:oxygen-independent coproporphyrinogen III oxidase
MDHISYAAHADESKIKEEEIALEINGKAELPTREEFYTNYPFFKYWRSESNDKLIYNEGINIYIHIPFCIQICDYCFYMKELVKSKDQVDEYLDHICKEMQLASEAYGLLKRKVRSVYIGGGTPSILTEPQFKKLMEALYRYHDMDSPEFTFEAEPGTFNKNKLGWYKEHGVNRISMGVQSFDDEVIKSSSRKHTAQTAINAIRMINELGGLRVNIDLLSGLAGDKMDTWEKSVTTALDQGVDMLTIYKMKAYANTVFFMKGVHKKEMELPTAENEISFMKRALEKVREAGYRPWSNFAFTKDGHLHRYVENTWRGMDTFAYGASSFGTIGHVNYQNLNNMKLYFEKINNQEMPVYRTFRLSAKDQIVKELLLCAARLASYRKAEFIAKFGFDYFNLIPGTITALTNKGYIEDRKDELVLTEQGLLFGDFVGKVIASSVKEALGSDSIGFVY